MPTMDDYRDELRAIFREAEVAGRPYAEVKAGDLHRRLGGYPSHDHQMPVCCDAMYEAQRAGDATISAPPKGKGATLTIRYTLPR